jgi:hypothetical protein
VKKKKEKNYQSSHSEHGKKTLLGECVSRKANLSACTKKMEADAQSMIILCGYRGVRS